MEKGLKIAIGADHGGFRLKQTVCDLLEKLHYQVIDVGCFAEKSVDYPDYAQKVVSEVENCRCPFGILICGTGIGMSIAANRSPKIRAALCHDLFTARMSKEHNNANVLCLGARVLDYSLALSIVETWLKSDFEGGRHQHRIDKIGIQK